MGHSKGLTFRAGFGSVTEPFYSGIRNKTETEPKFLVDWKSVKTKIYSVFRLFGKPKWHLFYGFDGGLRGEIVGGFNWGTARGFEGDLLGITWWFDGGELKKSG